MTIKSMNGLAAIKKLDIDYSYFDWLLHSGFEVKLTASAFEFVNPELISSVHDGVVATVPVTITLLKALNDKTIGTADKKVLRKAIHEAIIALEKNTVYSKPKPKPIGALGMLSTKNVVAAMDEITKDKDAPPVKGQQAPVEHVLGVSYFDLSKLETEPCIPLRDANKMYQPVAGTSAGSRYFMIGSDGDLRIGVKYSGNSVSLRVEGKNFNKYVGQVTAAGFNVSHPNYGSLHLNVDDEVIARKCVGALLMGLGIKMKTPVPDLDVIKNKS